MEQLMEFATNHPLLVGGFVLVLLALIVTEVQRTTRKFKMISSAEAIRLINREDAAVVDVSASGDFSKKHIVGAINVVPSQIQANNKQLMKLQGRPIVVYCKNGQASNQSASQLMALGLAPVHVLRGGLAQWQQDQHPVI